jgi:hypothetical protein
MALLCGFVLSVAVPALGLCADAFVGHLKHKATQKNAPTKFT